MQEQTTVDFNVDPIPGLTASIVTALSKGTAPDQANHAAVPGRNFFRCLPGQSELDLVILPASNIRCRSLCRRAALAEPQLHCCHTNL